MRATVPVTTLWIFIVFSACSLLGRPTAAGLCVPPSCPSLPSASTVAGLARSPRSLLLGWLRAEDQRWTRPYPHTGERCPQHLGCLCPVCTLGWHTGSCHHSAPEAVEPRGQATHNASTVPYVPGLDDAHQ